MTVRKLLCVMVPLAMASGALATDVTMARQDAQRTGRTAEKLSPPLALLWKFATGPDAGYSTSPLVVGNRVFFCSQGVVYALDTETGEIIWQYETRFAIRSTPVFLEGHLVVAAVNGEIHILDTVDQTDKRLFALVQVRGGVTTDLLLADGTIYIAADNGQLYAMSVKTLDPQPLVKHNVPPKRAMVYADGYLYFTGGDNLLYCVDVKRKRTFWAQPQGNLVTPPAVWDGKPVVGTRDDARMVRTGRTVWRQTKVTAARGGPAVADDKIYLFDRNDLLLVLDPKRGDVVNAAKTDSACENAATIADQEVYFGTDVGNVYCVDAATLTAKWYYRCSPIETIGPNLSRQPIAVPPVVANGAVYAVSLTGTLFCLRADAVDVGKPRLYLPQIVTLAEDNSAVAIPLIDDELRAALVAEAEANKPEDGKVVLPPEAEELKLAGKQRVFTVETYVYDEGSGVDMTGIRVLWDGQPFVSELMTVTPNDYLLTINLVSQKSGAARAKLDDGKHTLKITVPDFKGNSVVREFTFTIDNSLPPPKPVAKPKPEAGPGGPPGAESPPA